MQCIYATQGLPRCFVFDWSFECSKFLERQNQSVQLRLFMYMSPTLAFPHKGLPARIGAANVQNKLNNKKYKWHFLLTQAFISRNLTIFVKERRTSFSEKFISFDIGCMSYSKEHIIYQ